MTPKFIEEVKRIFEWHFGERYEVEVYQDEIDAKHLSIKQHLFYNRTLITKKYPACIENQQTKTKVNLVIMEIEELLELLEGNR